MYSQKAPNPVGARFGLEEVEGGIGIDSCASDNVMSRRHLPGYKIHPSPGSKRGQKWGSASGHSIRNEGQATYKFVTDAGGLARGTTQIGEVKRPLAAVSKIAAAGNIVLFSTDSDYIIDKSDPIAAEILQLVRKIRKKTPMYLDRGTYRMRAWIVPENANLSECAPNAAPFGGQGKGA